MIDIFDLEPRIAELERGWLEVETWLRIREAIADKIERRHRKQQNVDDLLHLLDLIDGEDAAYFREKVHGREVHGASPCRPAMVDIFG